jgi:ribose transport system permease protein
MQRFKDSFNHFRRLPAFTGFVLFVFALLLTMILQGPGNFFTEQNINNLFVTGMAFMLVCIGQSVLLISGTLDLSIGIQVALVNVVTIMTVYEWGIPVMLGCLIGIVAAILASLVCWLFVSVFRLPDLLASFALIFAIRGINQLIMPVPLAGVVNMSYHQVYDMRLLGFFPFAALFLVFIILLWAYLRRTKFGTNIYAVGANPQNAFAVGISPIKVQLQAFIFKGFVVGLAGMCITFLTLSGNPNAGEEWGLRSIAAGIVGGLTFGGWGGLACGIFGGGFFILIQHSVPFFFRWLFSIFPALQGVAVVTFWHNLFVDIIIFLGLLMTIVTMKGQREALRASVQSKYSFKRRDKNAN